MNSTDQGADTNAADVYRSFIDAVNDHDLEEAARFVDVARYRENCVGFTRGFVDWQEAQKSVRQVWKGLPDLRVELTQILANGDVALAHGTVRGTATGRLYGAPATKRSFQASFFDFARVDGGRIVERVQQTDVLAQMRQLYGRALGLAGLDVMFLRLLPLTARQPSPRGRPAWVPDRTPPHTMPWRPQRPVKAADTVRGLCWPWAGGSLRPPFPASGRSTEITVAAKSSRVQSTGYPVRSASAYAKQSAKLSAAGF